MERIPPLPANTHTDLQESFDRYRGYLGYVLNGFLNRWNDTMAPALEDEPRHFGETHLAPHGWRVGKHGR